MANSIFITQVDGLHADHMTTEVVQNFRRNKTLNWPNYPTGLRLEQDAYSPLASMTWFHSAGCRASWKAGRLWAAVTASGGPMEGMLGTKSTLGRREAPASECRHHSRRYVRCRWSC